MKKCGICGLKDGKFLVCQLCASNLISKQLISNHPEYYKEEIVSLFEDRFIPQLNTIEEELSFIKKELRIRKAKRRYKLI